MAVSIGNPSRTAATSQTAGATPIGVPEAAAEAVKAGKLEAVTVRKGDTLWDLWSKSNRGTWEDFKSLNSHLTADPRRNNGDLIVPGDSVLLPAAQAAEAKAKPWQAAAKAKAASDEVGAKAGATSATKAEGATAPAVGATPPAAAAVKTEPGAAAPPAAAANAPTGTTAGKPVDAAAAKAPADSPAASAQKALADLKAAGFAGEPTPQALASELAKRVLDPVSIDNAFLNAALGYAHATNTAPALNTELGKIVEGRVEKKSQGSSEDVAQAAKKSGAATDGYLRGLIGLQNSDSAKKRSEDLLTKGADQHRGTTTELVAEGALGMLKSIAEHPVKAAITAAAVTAGVVALPIAAAAGAIALGASTAAAATAALATGGAISGYFAVDGAKKIYGGAKDILAADKLTGAERDEKLIHAGGELAAGVPSLVGAGGGAAMGLKVARAVVARGAMKGPELLAISNSSGAPQLPGPGATPLLTGPTVAELAASQLQEQAKSVAFGRPPQGGAGGQAPATSGPLAGSSAQAPGQAAGAKVPSAADPVVAPKAVDVPGTVKQVANYDALRSNAIVYTAKPGESLADALKHARAQTAKLKTVDTVWIEGTEANSAFPGKLIAADKSIKGISIFDRKPFANEAPVRLSAGELAAEKAAASRANDLSRELGEPVTYNRVEFTGVKTADGRPVGRYIIGGRPAEKFQEVREAAAQLGTPVEWNFYSRQGQGLQATVQPTGSIKVSIGEIKPEAQAGLPEYLRSISESTKGPVEVESVWASNQRRPFTMQEGRLLKPAEAPAEVRAAFEAKAEVERANTGFTDDGARPLDVPMPEAPAPAAGAVSAAPKRAKARRGGNKAELERAARDAAQELKGSPASVLSRSQKDIWAENLQANILPRAKVNAGKGVELAPEGSVVGIVEIRGDNAIVITRLGSEKIPLSSLSPATAVDRGLAVGSPVKILGKLVGAGEEGRVTSLNDNVAVITIPGVNGASRQLQVPLDYLQPVRSFGAEKLKGAPASVLSRSQKDIWAENLQAELIPRAKVNAGQGVELAPEGSVVGIVEIRGDNAIVITRLGSEQIPLSSLSPATAVDRGLAVGSPVKILGKVVGAGEEGRVVSLNSNGAVVSIPGVNGASRQLQVPLDYLQPVRSFGA